MGQLTVNEILRTNINKPENLGRLPIISFVQSQIDDWEEIVDQLSTSFRVVIDLDLGLREEIHGGGKH